jgi:anti-anti-sigma factor
MVELVGDGPTCTLTLSGSLSGTSIAALEAQVDQLGSTPCRDVIIDVRLLSAIDQVGVNVLVGLNHYVEARGGQMTVVGASGEVAAALRNCELIGSTGQIERGVRSREPKPNGLHPSQWP